MQTIWGHGLHTETLRLLHCAHQIATGFFRLNGFIVLPYPTAVGENVVSFPDLPYLSIPRFWSRAARIDIHSTPSIKMDVPEDLVAAAQNLLVTAHLPRPDTSSLQKSWNAGQGRIMSCLYRLIPGQRNRVKSLTIWPTAFGTNCSFSLCDPASRSHHIFVWLRADQGLAGLVEAIVTSLTRADIYSRLNGVWGESEAVTDWLLAYSPLSQIVPDVDPVLTLRATRRQQSARLVEESQSFLAKIGTPTASPRQVDTTHFSQAEKRLFQLLLSRSPNVVTFDELSTADPENFSLYAVSKSIQRLRNRLEKSSISGSFIQTKRGEGYLIAT